jgi:glycosyltransferase involved in cell wall biosynthesis
VRDCRPRCAALLPVRNGGQHLAGWFDSISPVADFVVALDDGSTDDTFAVLESESLVRRVLVNPARESYEGWNDWANRQRLIQAATRIGTDWCLFVDADERLAADDAAALRQLIDNEAQAGFVYGFERFRMSRYPSQVDPRGLWVYRLFAAADACAPLRRGRLHAMPVPSSIPMARWLPTSIRLQHLDDVDDDDREARYAKYREADPNNEWRAVYDQILDAPPRLVAWERRAPDLPLLLGREGRYADHSSLPPSSVAITVVVIARNDEAAIDRSIEALLSQHVDEEFEVIVVGSGTDETIARARKHGNVRCFQLPDPALPGDARNVGLWAARGEYVVFPSALCQLAPETLATRITAHDEGCGLHSAVVPGNRAPDGWVSYDLDGAAEGPSRRGAALDGPDGAGPSYVVSDLRSVGGFPADMPERDDAVRNVFSRTATNAPLLAVGGRCDEAPTGLLVGGTTKDQVQRLRTLACYALHKGPVTPALAPIVTSATLTSEGDGFSVLHSPTESVDRYLAAVHDVGAVLLLQVQPGRAPLDWIVSTWHSVLKEPDVELLVDLRPEVAFADQANEIAGIVDDAVLRGHAYIRLAEGQRIPDLPNGVEQVEFLDLRRPGIPLPHDRKSYGHTVYQ